MAANDLYLLTLFGELFGQQTVNTFTYYQVTDETAPVTAAQVLADQWATDFITPTNVLRGPAISIAMSYKSIRVVNLFNDASDFYEKLLPANTNGTGTGGAMPPFVSYAFRTAWLGSGVRRGQKRFAGVLEDEVNNGVLTSNVINELEDLRAMLGDPIVASGGNWQPVIVRRVKTLDPETGRYIYSYPTNPSQLFQVEANSWQIVNNATTQNSRKYGRGI